MREIIKRVNLYFFDEEVICLSDALWFYGFYGLIITCLLVTIIL